MMGSADQFKDDIDAVASIPAVPTILETVCRTTGMGFAAIARVTTERWIVCEVRDTIDFGLRPGGELKVETTICDAISRDRAPVAIDHVSLDECYASHPTPAMYGFQSYVSVPIVLPDGSFFGTLCAIDPRPARVNTPETLGLFKLFAELIAFHLDAQQRLRVSEATILDERQASELREQFIAVLGHDLRNPLASVDAGTRALGRIVKDDKAVTIVTLIQGSVRRMAGLIDNVLDFARGRLGGGLSLARARCDLEPILRQVVEELRSSQPDRSIETDFRGIEAVDCDGRRVGQLVSNLLANALTHGAQDRPVRIEAFVERGAFELSIANEGIPISATVLKKIFQPFERGAVRPGQQGLGLGLYIASSIAEAHGGSLEASSSGEETKFTFRVPAAI